MFVLTRQVTRDECEWLRQDLPEGLLVYGCRKYLYGCIGPKGTGVTLDPDGDYPFFEVPTDALLPVVTLDQGVAVTGGFAAGRKDSA